MNESWLVDWIWSSDFISVIRHFPLFLSIRSVRIVTFDNWVISLDSNITIDTPVRRESVLHDPVKNRLRRRGRSKIPSYDFVRSETEIRFIARIIHEQAAWSTSRVSRDSRGVLNQRNNWSCLVQVLLHVHYCRRVVVIPKIWEGKFTRVHCRLISALRVASAWSEIEI